MSYIGDDPDLIEERPARRVSFARAWRALVDVVMPPQCPVCRAHVTEPATICPACWGEFRPITRPFCEKTATPFSVDLGPGVLSPEAFTLAPPWERARAAALYEGTAAKLVTALKFGDRHDVAPLIARHVARAGADILPDADLIVPVPLHRGRLWSRRFNQAAEIGRRVAAIAGRPFATDVLLRRKATPPQVGLDRDQRARNIAGAFAVPTKRAERIAGKRVIVIDDVFTTGATLVAATRVLRRAGASAVDVLVFARVGEVIEA